MADKEHYTIRQMERGLREAKGFTTIAARKIGCDYHTLMKYIKKYKHLQTVLDEINESMLDFSESKLVSQIKENNITAIIFHLKCKGKKRGYVERIEQEHSGRDGGPIVIVKTPENFNESDM